jgi:glycosyltransferase involved in cell wall biosynthesis
MSIYRPPDPIAYLTGEYPKVSHTFIQREVQALRKRGLAIQTFSIRRAPAVDLVADQRDEERDTFYVLENCRRLGTLAGAHLRQLFAEPKVYLNTLRLAWRMRSQGIKAASYQLFYFAEAVVLAEELKRRGIVHLHNHFGDSSCNVAILASAMCGIPFSFTEHGPNVFFEAKRWQLDEKVARAKFVVAVSHFCRSQLMLFSRQQDWNKISVVHCGVALERYEQGQKPGFNKHVLFVGRLEPVKGVAILLEAMAKVRSRHPDAQLTIVGSGSCRAELEAQAHGLGLTQISSFVGNKTQAEVADLLATADLLVLPSFAEGLPVVLMEAMASGKPVIATRVAGVQELLEESVSGFAVPPGDAASLAQRIDQVLTNEVLSKKMGEAGRQIVEREFNIDSEALLLAKMFAKGATEIRARPNPPAPKPMAGGNAAPTSIRASLPRRA